MYNAKMVVNVLLVATIFSAAYHRALPKLATPSVDLSVFLIAEGAIHSLEALAPTKADSVDVDSQESQSVKSYGPVYTVTATAYQAVKAQTDDEPFVTADNSFIKPGYSSKLHWLAVSRDLLVQWGGRIKFGDRVRVKGVSPELDGIYTVHDTMNKRLRHRIDILSNPSEKFDICARGVKIQRVKAGSQTLLAARRPATAPLLASSKKARRTLGPAGRSTHRFVRPAERTDYLVSAIL